MKMTKTRLEEIRKELFHETDLEEPEDVLNVLKDMLVELIAHAQATVESDTPVLEQILSQLETANENLVEIRREIVRN